MDVVTIRLTEYTILYSNAYSYTITSGQLRKRRTAHPIRELWFTYGL
jgi:hypothetical protein